VEERLNFVKQISPTLSQKSRKDGPPDLEQNIRYQPPEFRTAMGKQEISSEGTAAGA